MKIEESFMLDEKCRNTFFDPSDIFDKLGINEQIKVAADLGTGYDTFLDELQKIADIALCS